MITFKKGMMIISLTSMATLTSMVCKRGDIGRVTEISESGNVWVDGWGWMPPTSIKPL